MKYCSNCILPDSRPNIVIEADGVCNACKGHQKKGSYIDWDHREKQFREVTEHAKNRSKGYDCLIPVSGGKDSTWQVVKCLEYGMNPLAVTWKTPGRTQIGQENLDNLVALGVDHIDYQINPKVEKRFMLESLKKYGTTALPMHMALFNIPLTIAVRFNIPLVVWGENSADEYGGAEENKGVKLDRKWLKKHGVTHGTTAEDWLNQGFSQRELTPYFGPTDEEMEKAGVRAVFLGYYFEWDVATSLEVATTHGFKVRTEGPKIGYYNYADIDDDFISIHHYIKWYKFGMTRLFDNLSLEIRNNRMTRENAIRILGQFGSQRPHEDIRKLCEFLEISEETFNSILETFRNKMLWKRDADIWRIDNFIIKNWNWHEN